PPHGLRPHRRLRRYRKAHGRQRHLARIDRPARRIAREPVSQDRHPRHARDDGSGGAQGRRRHHQREAHRRPPTGHPDRTSRLVRSLTRRSSAWERYFSSPSSAVLGKSRAARNSPSAERPSTWSANTFTTRSSGTAMRAPTIPQSQPQNAIARKIATGFISSRRPRVSGVTS